MHEKVYTELIDRKNVGYLLSISRLKNTLHDKQIVFDKHSK